MDYHIVYWYNGHFKVLYIRNGGIDQISYHPVIPDRAILCHHQLYINIRQTHTGKMETFKRNENIELFRNSIPYYF